MLTTRQVCERAGITYRMLDYWCRTGLVRPSRAARGSGTRREFTEAEARAVRLAAALMRLGATTQVVAPVVARWQEMPEWEWEGLLVVHADGTSALGAPIDVAGWVVDLAAVAGRERLLASA